MANIVSIANTFPVIRFPVDQGSSPTTQQVANSDQSVDRVEISALGKAFSQLQADSSYRAARIHAIRQEIEGGRFETPERIQGTVDRLMEALR